MQKIIRKILKLPLTAALRVPFIRDRVVYHVRADHFAGLGMSIPLGDGFWCPILTPDSVHSFGEIFVSHEYGSFLDEIPLPSRWIDLGCHAGYFTLYLAWQLALAAKGKEWRALLIDADPRMEALARRALDQNPLSGRYEFLPGLISRTAGEQEFALRDGMVSSKDTDLHGVLSVRKVGVVTAAAILAALPPPYDLIKIDIEGAETDFLEGYKDVYANTSAIVMEWHSADREGSAAARLQGTLEGAGFRLAKELRPMRAEELKTGWVSSGVQLYRRVGGADGR